VHAAFVAALVLTLGPGLGLDSALVSEGRTALQLGFAERAQPVIGVFEVVALVVTKRQLAFAEGMLQALIELSLIDLAHSAPRGLLASSVKRSCTSQASRRVRPSIYARKRAVRERHRQKKPHSANHEPPLTSASAAAETTTSRLAPRARAPRRPE